MAWDPEKYAEFSDHRLRPVIDLTNRISLSQPGTVVDLGCGAGSSTTILKARWPEANVIGIDNSHEMLESARQAHPDIVWRAGDLNDWDADAPLDLLFSNAALHWLPDHPALFPKLFKNVAPDGVFAVQMPENWEAPSHISVSETVFDGPWRQKLEPLIGPRPTLTPDHYYDLLTPLARSVEMWETIYHQELEGANPVADFVKGTWLKPFLDALEEPQRSAFEDAYRARIKAAYPPSANGKTLFPFRRLFIIATR